MVAAALCLCDGAHCSVLLTKLRPSRAVADVFPNQLPRQRLNDLVAVWQEETTRRGHTFQSIFMISRHSLVWNCTWHAGLLL